MENASQTETPRNASGNPGANERLQILFADDDAGMSWLVQRYLESNGHSVHVVHDGREAVEAVQQQTFDVVMLDLLMPTMDGIEAATKIREFAEHTGQRFPIIAATSHRIEHLGDRWDETLFDAVLSKPVQNVDLAEALAAFVH